MIADELKKHIVCFTGHRELSHKDIHSQLDNLSERLIKQGYIHYAAGGALGFDTEAALAVLRAREKHPHIKLILILPYHKQAKNWDKEQQVLYENIKMKADKVTYTCEKYSRGCFHMRNRALVDGSSLCVAYLVKGTGGSAYTVGYAEKKGVKIINIAE